MAGETILIVEDDGILAVDLMESLKVLKYRVLKPVSTGRAAVEAAEQQKPDLVLMDIDLSGGMNGIEAAALIREQADVPVVFLTGYSQDSLLMEARDTAPYGYLVKPVPERELVATIEIALYRHALDRVLRESEERYRALVENANEAILVASDGLFVFMNPKMKELLGGTEEELINQPFGSFIHPDDLDMVMDRHRRRVAGEDVPTGYLFRVMRKDGAYRWVQINAVLIEWKGKPATLNILNDITDRMTIEEALRKSENLFRTIFEHAPFGIAMLDREGHPFLVNNAVHRMLGYTGSEIAHMGFPDFTHPDDRQKGRELFQELLEGKRDIYAVEKRYTHKDGSLVWTNLAAFLVRDEQGRPESVIGMTDDITGLKKAEDALRQSEALFRNLVDNMLDPVLIINFDGKAVFGNKATERLVGLPTPPPGETVDITPFLVPASLEKAIADLETLEREGGPIVGELEIITASGEHRWVEGVSVKIPYGGGHADLATLRDITERRRAEERLRESELRFRAIYQKSPIAIEIYGGDGGLLSANQACLEVFGISNEESVKGFNLFDDPNVSEEMKADLRLGREVRYQTEFDFEKVRELNLYPSTKSGTIWLDVIIAPLGEAGGYLVQVQDITGRRLSEEMLRKSEELYRTIFDSSPLPIYLLRNMRVIYANPAVAKLMGYDTSEDMVSRASEKNAPPEFIDIVKKRVLEGMSGISQGPIELTILRADGMPVEVEIFPEPILLKDGPALLVTGQDLTERRKAEQALRDSEKQYRQLVEALQEGIWAIDKDGFTSFVNPRMAQMLGYTQEEMAGRHLFEFMAPEIVEIVKGRIEERRNGISSWHESKYLRKDGSQICVNLATSPLFDDDGNYAGALAGVIDITDRKNMEEEVKLSRANLSALIESTDDIIWSVDRDLRLITYNTKFDQHLKEAYGTRARVGDKPEDRLAPEKADVWRGLYARALEEGPFRAEYTLSDGRVLEVSLSPIRREGEITGVSVFGKDVTERRRFEEEKGRFERQLQQAQKMEAIGSLAGGIAHDFNNILSTIIGNAEMSLEEDSLDGIHYNLRQILSGSTRARDLVRQILTFSRPRKQEQKTMDLKDIIAEAAKLLKATLPSNISIKAHLGSKDHLVYGDPSQIHQVVINLCTNAAHAMSKKGGKLGIDIRKDEITRGNTLGTVDLADGPYNVIQVSDTGHGIEPGIMDKIFDPFFTTKGPGEGTGLGLAVVYGIVKSHGGTITVETTPGKGSLFRVFLPLSTARKEEDARAPAGGLGGREKILFVDDEPQIVEIVKKALCALGYDLTVCGNPLQALKLFKKDPQRFDLVITDLSMPNMTGKDLARALNKLRPDIPVILSTGHNELVGEEDLEKFGIRDLLLKPVSLREYALSVRRVLDGKP
jgi:two-component system, cell cycle sensor histidine kinase and response regulator CckA